MVYSEKLGKAGFVHPWFGNLVANITLEEYKKAIEVVMVEECLECRESQPSLSA